MVLLVAADTRESRVYGYIYKAEEITDMRAKAVNTNKVDEYTLLPALGFRLDAKWCTMEMQPLKALGIMYCF
jgi:hypothetical protein